MAAPSKETHSCPSWVVAVLLHVAARIAEERREHGSSSAVRRPVTRTSTMRSAASKAAGLAASDRSATGTFA